MTTRWPCIVVAMLCTLLTFATSASADCAWVLWAFSASFGGWMPLDGFTDREKCAAEREFRRTQTRPPETRPPSFACFPDTVDPRGPKAK